MIVPLFYLTNVKYGGFASYTAHLFKGLMEEGHRPILCKVGTGKRSENKARPFTHGVAYRNVCVGEAAGMVRAAGGRAVITCAYWRTHADRIEPLLKAGASIVIHDPTELHKEMNEAIKKYGNKVIAIRKTNLENFTRVGLDTTFVPHPYVRTPIPKAERDVHAITLSRLDFDKHTDIIVQANDALDTERRVKIYGAPNRMYVHHKLEKTCPNWKDYWEGEFPQTQAGPIELAARAKFMVDMSVIAGDGDGTQYTFLEAWDAGAQLVVNKGWVCSGTGAVNESTASIVDGPEELAEVLRKEPDQSKVEAGLRIVEQHAPEHIVPRFMEALK